jgi:hypothetical protein
MAELFGVNVPAISKHLSNIYEEGELSREVTVSKMETVQNEGGRQVTRNKVFLGSLTMMQRYDQFERVKTL